MGYRILKTEDIDYKTNDLALLKYQILERNNVYYLQLKVKNIGSKIIKSFKIIYKIDDNLFDYEVNYLAKPNDVFLSKNLIEISSPNFSFIGFLDVKYQENNIKEVEADIFGFDDDFDNTESDDPFDSSDIISDDNSFEDYDNNSKNNSDTCDFNDGFEEDSVDESNVKSTPKNKEESNIAEVTSFENTDSVNETDSFGFDEFDDSDEEIKKEKKPKPVREKKVKVKKSHKGLIITLCTIFSLVLVGVAVLFFSNFGSYHTDTHIDSSVMNPVLNIFEGKYHNNNDDESLVIDENHNFTLIYNDRALGEVTIKGSCEYDNINKNDGLILKSETAKFAVLDHCKIDNNKFFIDLDIFVKPNSADHFLKVNFSLIKTELPTDRDEIYLGSYSEFDLINRNKYGVIDSDDTIQKTFSSIDNVYFIQDCLRSGNPIIDVGNMIYSPQNSNYILDSILSENNSGLVNPAAITFYYCFEGESTEFVKFDKTQDSFVFNGTYYTEDKRNILKIQNNQKFYLNLDYEMSFSGAFYYKREMKENGLAFFNPSCDISSLLFIGDDTIKIEMYIRVKDPDSTTYKKFEFYKDWITTDYERELCPSYNDFKEFNKYTYKEVLEENEFYSNKRLTSKGNLYFIQNLTSATEGDIIQCGYIRNNGNQFELIQKNYNGKYNSIINLYSSEASIYVGEKLIKFTQHYNDV